MLQQEAEASMEAGNTKQARRLLSQAEKLDPNDEGIQTKIQEIKKLDGLLEQINPNDCDDEDGSSGDGTGGGGRVDAAYQPAGGYPDAQLALVSRESGSVPYLGPSSTQCTGTSSGSAVVIVLSPWHSAEL